jgi:hypothetical protein
VFVHRILIYFTSIVAEQDLNCSVYLTQNMLKTVGAEDPKTKIYLIIGKALLNKAKTKKKTSEP